jgi:hypothetical protein
MNSVYDSTMGITSGFWVGAELDVLIGGTYLLGVVDVN